MADRPMPKERLRYWFDTEFMEDGKTIEPLSIGIVCEDGRSFYAEFADADLTHANTWVETNVLPHMRWLGHDDEKTTWTVVRNEGTPGGALVTNGYDERHMIAEMVKGFVAERADRRPEFWAYFADYDWIVMCQLFGTMMQLPHGWPMLCLDIKQEAIRLGNPTLPAHTGREHHALEDARWDRAAWTFLQQYEQYLDALFPRKIPAARL